MLLLIKTIEFIFNFTFVFILFDAHIHKHHNQGAFKSAVIVPCLSWPQFTMTTSSSAVAVLSGFPMERLLMASITSNPCTTWPNIV
mmetsp:Transcript_1476/g.3033  ORF Transcript_1476/g.3033 Transcript_1476/m.3033 type:complete len:86 (-) Transcript_1476:907-1164(-)